MKRLSILFISLLLLAACGRATQAPEEPTTEATTIITTTEAPTTEFIEPKPQNPDALPFTKDDITAIEAQFKTVRDYVKAVPATWYEVDHQDAYGCEIYIRFFDHEPITDSRAFLLLQLLDETLCDIIEYKFDGPTQELPKVLLDAKDLVIKSIDFTKTGSAITPPRGIKIGDDTLRIFEAYPNNHPEDYVLYDITAIFPEAKPEWGKWDGEGYSNIDFLGGGIMENGVGFSYAEQPWGWDDRESDYTWLNMYNPRYLLTYQVKDDVITGIEYMLLYHPG